LTTLVNDYTITNKKFYVTIWGKGEIMSDRFKFDRMELAGSLGDLGALLPIAIAMVLFNGLSPVGLFFSIGVFYILSGSYFGMTVPVQPMKVIGAYAIATAMTAEQILASGLLMGVFLLIVGMTGAIDVIRKFTPKSVVRGVQLSTGALLISGGVKFIMGTSHLTVQALAGVPISVIIGIIGAVATLLLLDNRKFPAGLIVVAGGLVLGLIFGIRSEISSITVGVNLPQVFPFEFPAGADFTFALFALVLPQLPMTMGNAVIAYTDLSAEYFPDKASKLTNRKACVSMALANFFSFSLGGMPLCHGAGGLAAHYRFGARTAGSNLMIGGLFVGLAIVFGNSIVQVFNLIPMSILGVLLIFAGAQLTLAMIDLNQRKDLFVATLILGITLASNLAAGFIAGMVVAHVLRWEKLSV
jgi:SulP family sulfate permease